MSITLHVLAFKEILCVYHTVPVTLVDYYRADYPTSPPENNFLYQFYFVFLREVLVGINGLEVTAFDLYIATTV